MKKKNGFTLVELLVTIALILMVLGIAIVSIIKVSDAKKEEAYVLVKDQIMTAAEQYFYANEYLFEGLSEGSSGVITVGKLVEEDYLNKVTDPRTGKAINNCSQIQVTKTNGKFKSSFKEYGENMSCENNNLVIVSEPGAPGIDVKPSVELRDREEWYNISNLNGKNLIMKVTTKTNGNGRIVGIKKCSGESDCTNFKDDYDTTDSSLDDSDTFSADTEGKHACYQATNISNKSARACVHAKVDTTKPTVEVVPEKSNWTNGDVKYSFSASDNISIGSLISYWNISDLSDNEASSNNYKWNGSEYPKGGSQTEYSIDNSNEYKQELKKSDSFKKPGSRRIRLKVCDVAGNCSYSNEGIVKIDKVKPECKLTVTSGTKGNIVNGRQWYTSNVGVGFSKKTDDLSGVSTTSITNGGILKDNKQDYKFTGTVVDVAGNKGTCSIVVSKDSEVPTMAFDIESKGKITSKEWNSTLGVYEGNGNYSKGTFKYSGPWSSSKNTWGVYYSSTAPGWDPVSYKCGISGCKAYEVMGCARDENGVWKHKTWSTTFLLSTCKGKSTSTGNCIMSGSKDDNKDYFKYKYRVCSNAGLCSDGNLVIEHFYSENTSNHGGCSFYN